jgi:6-pyruvoyl-tetrahydropterin synthase related domain
MTTNEDRPTERHWLRFDGPAVILLAALVATAPQLFRSNSCGHDFNFHLVSWLDAQASWRHGILYPHWSSSPNYGAGEPRFVFYPPLTWMLGAALGLATPWKAVMIVYKFWKCVPIVITFLFLAGVGLATRALARQALDNGAATLAGGTALFSGYALFTAYERSAFGELTGGIWIPLLLLLMLRDHSECASVWRRSFDGSAVPLALVLAGAWLSNAPLGVMASYLLAAVALVRAMLLRSWAPVLRASAAAVIGIGLSAVYLVPASVEQRWVEIRQATEDPGSLIENSWMFARHADPALELHDLELLKVSVIGLTMISVAAGGLFVAWRRGRLPEKGAWWVPLALIPLVVLLLQFPVSLPIWNALPKLRFLQFPWRWLVVVEAPMGIFFASAVWSAGRRLHWFVISACSAFFIGAAVFTGFVLFQRCDYEDSVAGTLDVYRYHVGYEGTDEYAPPGSDNSQVAIGLPDACLTSNPSLQLGHGEQGTTPAYVAGICDAAFSWNSSAGRSNAEHLRIAAVAPHAGYLILKLRTYPAWRTTVNGRQVDSSSRREDGLMVLPVPEGSVQIAVDWSTTKDVMAGRWLSALSLALICLVGWIERKVGTRRFAEQQGRLSEPRLS